MGAGWIVLTVFGSLILLLVLLLLSHVRLRVVLNENGSFFRVRWLVIRRTMQIEDASQLFEHKRKEKPTEEGEKEQEKPAEQKEEEKKKISLSRRIARLTRLLGRIFDRLPGVLTLRARRVIVIVSTDDAAKTALLYGAVSASLAALTEIVDRSVARVKTRGRDEIDVCADFLSGKTRADIDVTLSARLLGMLRLLFVFLTFRGSEKKTKSKKKKQPSPALPEKTAQPND